MNHFDHPENMTDAAWSDRPRQITASPPHSQGWSDQQANEDARAASKSMAVALALAALLWIVMGGLLWWSVEILSK